jgi:uncharacterized membrane protein YgcG
MFTSPLTRSLLGVAALLLSTSLARAEFGGLRDNGAFFSESAKAEASRNIGEIGKRFKKDLVIETFQETPDALKPGVEKQDRATVNRLFEQWAMQQARQQKVNGIYVLITKVPAHLQVVVGNETQTRAFTLQDRDALVATMLARLRNKQNDEALLAGVNFVAATMKSHAIARSGNAAPKKSEAANAESSPWGWVLAAVLGAVAAWVVVGIIRSIFRAGGNAGGAAAAPAAGGGGFFSSLLGGMFGAAAGMWLYDQFSGHHDSGLGSDAERRGGDEAGVSGKDTDYSSSGDSFGDDSGGGDIGGGDSGGGDF